MGIQSAIENLVKIFLGYYIACAMIGRTDIPFKMVTELRGKTLAGTSSSWGCPSTLHKNACKEYNPKNYN